MPSTAADLRDRIARQLAKENGGGTMRWKRVLGEVRVYSRATHTHCNWDAWPAGPKGDVALVEAMIDRMRTEHPFVAD